jgi:Ca-activated chloride channel homolog
VKAKIGALAGLDFASAPPLKGFVIGKPKQFAEVLLEARDGQPLLVQTHYGLGKSVAFLSDVKNRWAADWLRWPGYGKLWAQLVRGSIRRDAGEELALRLTREGREAVVTLTASAHDGNYRNDIAPKVRVTEPGENSFVALLSHVGPGRYQARIPLRGVHSAPYRFEIVEAPGVTQQDIVRTGTRSLSYAYPDESRVLPANLALLKALSEQTGGSFAPKTEAIFANHADAGHVSRGLWQYFAAAALVVFLLDILVRRFPLGPRFRPR